MSDQKKIVRGALEALGSWEQEDHNWEQINIIADSLDNLIDKQELIEKLERMKLKEGKVSYTLVYNKAIYAAIELVRGL